MDKDTIEYLLSNYFNNIVWVSDNPAKFIITEISKVNGIIKTVNNEEIYNLKKRLISTVDDINRFLFSEIEDCDIKIIDYYPKNLISKILKIKGSNELNKEISSLSKNNWIITSTKMYDTLFTNYEGNIYINDYLENKIIIGDKDSKIIIHENLEEFYIDKSKIKIVELV